MADLNPFRYSSNCEDDLFTQLSDELRGIMSIFINDYTIGPKVVFDTELAEETHELHLFPTENFSGFLDKYFSLFEFRLNNWSYAKVVN